MKVLSNVLYITLQMFWLTPHIFIITLNLATLKPVYDVALFCYFISVFWEYQ